MLLAVSCRMQPYLPHMHAYIQCGWRELAHTGQGLGLLTAQGMRMCKYSANTLQTRNTGRQPADPQRKAQPYMNSLPGLQA